MLVLAVMIVLLVFSSGILLFQMMILRQIGVLYHRLGPDTSSKSLPTHATVDKVAMADGFIRTLRDSSPFSCLLVSSSCDSCVQILTSFESAGIPDGVSVGLADSKISLAELQNRYQLPIGSIFNAQDLARDLKVESVPALIVLDSQLRVLHRGPGKNRESIISEVQSATKPRDPSKVPSEAVPLPVKMESR